MQTIQDIVEMGYKPHEAKIMIECCEKHIGELYGCNKVIDIVYTNTHEKDITFQCTLCGKIKHKLFATGRNKWNEMAHSCECEIEKKFPKIKKAYSRNDDPSVIGTTFGNVKVIGIEHRKKNTSSGSMVMWECECNSCGETMIKAPSEVKKEAIKCKCQVLKEFHDFWDKRIGEQFGYLTVTGFFKKSNCKMVYANCICKCGNTHVAQYGSLSVGAIKSCGCLAKEKRNGRDESRTKSPLYSAWYGMRYRCNNPNAKAYKNYGGRGIKVCPEWDDKETGFESFEKWAYENGYIPDSGLSLDRIDVNGNYEPDNCRYTNIFAQSVNKRKIEEQKKTSRVPKTYKIGKKEQTIEEWCKEYNISSVAVGYRMKNLGMDFETALTTPKTRVGNKFAGNQSKERVANLNKCNSYIEANLYLAFIRATEEYKLVSQYKIGNYIADFIVEGTNLVIECDGYDNHKTKEQIAHDCKRDRFMANEGYIVLRFTGSEINDDPDGCANEIIESIKNICGESNENRKTYA